MKCRSSFILALWVGIPLIIVSGAILGICISGWVKGVNYTWDIAVNETMNTVSEELMNHLNFVRFAAFSVPFIEPMITTRSMPFSNYSPGTLIRMFDAFDGESGYTFGSFGIIMAYDTFVPPASPGVFTVRKVSWQVAKGFGCPDFIYAYSDASINPTFLGYCAQNLNASVPAYQGTDWGLSTEDLSLLSSGGETFLDVFQLLGQFTLTFKTAYQMIGKPYAITFAELNLKTFSDFVSKNVSVFGGVGNIYVYETRTRAMIASNRPDSVLSNGTVRLPAPNLTSGFVSYRRFNPYTGLDWTIALQATSYDVYQNLLLTTGIAGGVSAIIVVAAIVVSAILGHLWIRRKNNGSTPFKELVETESVNVEL